jgi:superfamily II DNA helicase RecQ
MPPARSFKQRPWLERRNRKGSAPQKDTAKGTSKSTSKSTSKGTSKRTRPGARPHSNSFLGERGAGLDNLEHSDPSFEERIRRVPGMKLEDLPRLVRDAETVERVRYQMEVVSCGLKLILKQHHPTEDREPRDDQVRVLRRMIYGAGDVLLIARTGWGKSIIFQAYSILTGKITLQIVPLNKLGDEQLQDIKKLPGAKPCLVNAETKKVDPLLIKRIKHGEFTHVLLGPEQASSDSFRDALKSQQLQSKIGLVAIDECHLIKQWKEFRDKFTMLGELRSILRDHVVWFACTATLDSEAEKLVLKNAGFRPIGTGPFHTEIVRTSIDRLDLSFCVSPIPRGGLTSYKSLYFLLETERSTEEAPSDLQISSQTATPQHIPKTILFVDSHTKIAAAAQYLRSALIAMTAELPLGQRFVAGRDNPALDVFNIVSIFTARVSTHDQNKRYNEFLKPDSLIRIMVATTTLGTGVNVPDVARVVIWQFPLGMDLAEIWQRAGRGGRAVGMRSTAYLFLPFWAFDDQGCNKPGQEDVIVKPNAKASKAKRRRNQLPSDRANRRQSALQYEVRAEELNDNGDDDSDRESACSISSQVDPDDTDDEPTTSTTLEHRKIQYWTKSERGQRSRLPDWWKRLCNDKCKREPVLEYLGEKKMTYSVDRISKRHCCNGCNPELDPVLVEPPVLAIEPLSQPRAASRAGVALEYIDKWAAKNADRHFSSSRWSMPPSTFMPDQLRWQLASLYAKNTSRNNDIQWADLNMEALAKFAPPAHCWRHWQGSGVDLIVLLQGLEVKVAEDMKKLLAEKKAAKARAKAAATAAEQGVHEEDSTRQGVVPTESSVLAASIRRDNETALSRLAISNSVLQRQSGNSDIQVGRSLGARSVTTPSSNIVSPRGIPIPTTPPPLPENVTPRPSSSPSRRRRQKMPEPFPESPKPPDMASWLQQVLNRNRAGDRAWEARRANQEGIAVDSQDRVLETELGSQTDSQAIDEAESLDAMALDSQIRVIETQLESQVLETQMDSQVRVPETQLESEVMLDSEEESINVVEAPLTCHATPTHPTTSTTRITRTPRTPSYTQTSRRPRAAISTPMSRQNTASKASKTAPNAKASPKAPSASHPSTPSARKRISSVSNANSPAKRREGRQPLVEKDTNIGVDAVGGMRSSRYSGRVITPSKWRTSR